jgi:hydrogenase expression/formation protein HypD
VFFAVGFETTAPTTAMAAYQAKLNGLRNFSLLVSHVLVPPVMEAVLNSPGRRVQAFLAAGHVCAVVGAESYRPLVEKYHVPIVVTGFEPLDILLGVLSCVRQLEAGRAEVENQYRRAVRDSGNAIARDLIDRVFTVVPRKWRGIGEIPESGLALRKDYRDFDAEARFDLSEIAVEEPSECLSGRVLQGFIKPPECPCFGTRCTPEHPFGAPMVSSEGACAAYYRYRGQKAPTAR